MSASNNVPSLYKGVVDEVINNVRESFLDEGIDEQVLQELKSLWETKIHHSRAISGGEIQPVPTQLTALHQQVKIQQAQMQQQSSVQPQTIQQGSQPQTVSLPVFLGGEGLDLSGAAAAAARALPPQIYQHQLGPGITIQQTSQGQFIAIPQGATFQTAGQQQIRIPIATTQAFTIPQTVQQIQTVPGQQVQPNTGQGGTIVQLDGANDTSSEEDDDDDDNDDNDNDDIGDDDNEPGGVEEEPLNSDDDVSEEDPSELFDTDNVVVCQYDKISRAKNRWKFHLKDGIMNLNGKDYVFSKATGDSEW